MMPAPGWPSRTCVRKPILSQLLLPGTSGPQAGAIDPHHTRYYRRRHGQGGGAPSVTSKRKKENRQPKGGSEHRGARESK